jgi:hypothetical protein
MPAWRTVAPAAAGFAKGPRFNSDAQRAFGDVGKPCCFKRLPQVTVRCCDRRLARAGWLERFRYGDPSAVEDGTIVPRLRSAFMRTAHLPDRAHGSRDRMIRYIVPAALLTLFAAPSAMAVPVAPSSISEAASADAAIIHIQDRRGRDHRGSARDHRPGPRFTPGGRYRSAPQGYRRYGARPGNWRTRGCILVGPVWFCP